MRNAILLAAVASAAIASAAGAATVGYTEGVRPTVAGTTNINGDASNSAPGFDLTNAMGLPGGSLSFGESVELYGRIVTAVDFYQFTSDVAFTVSLIADGFVAEGMGSNTSDFEVVNNATMASTATTLPTDQAPQLLFSLAAGDYTFSIDGSGGAARYDLRFEAAPVPVPAALPLLAAALGGLAALRRRG
jgi:hypothetical protein